QVLSVATTAARRSHSGKASGQQGHRGRLRNRLGRNARLVPRDAQHGVVEVPVGSARAGQYVLVLGHILPDLDLLLLLAELGLHVLVLIGLDLLGAILDLDLMVPLALVLEADEGVAAGRPI